MGRDETNDRMAATSIAGSDAANNGSNVSYSCSYCDRSYGTKIGLGQHKRHAHPEELNNERQAYQRPSRGVGLRKVVSDRRQWTQSEITSLVKFHLELRKANHGISETVVNERLAKMLPGRSAEAIKCFKRSDKYRSTLSQMIESAREAARARDRETLANTVVETPVPSTVTLPLTSTTVVEESLVMRTVVNNNPESESPNAESASCTQGVEEVNGNTLPDSTDAAQHNCEELTSTVVVTPVPSTITLPQTPTTVVEESLVAMVDINNNPIPDSSSTETASSTREEEAIGVSMQGVAVVRQFKETGLNNVDYQLLAKLKDDATLYSNHITSKLGKSYYVKLLLHVLNMGRGAPAVNTLLEKWLEMVIKVSNTKRITSRRHQPKIREGYGSGKGLRGKERLAEKVHLQRIYNRSGVKGIAQHVLRDVEFEGSTPNNNNPEPTPESMTEFWSDVFGNDILRSNDTVVSTTDEDSTANCLWEVITQDDIKSSELGSNKARGPDKISVKTWKSIPKAIRALFYNVVMYHGVVLESMSAARTIFIPKVAAPSKPGEYRPISITSVLQRQLHKILVNRLGKVRRFDDRQTAFRNGVDGTSNNLATLRTIIEVRKRTNCDLHVVFLDLKKAFDSVSHQAVFQTMSDLKCPTLFINYLKQLYSKTKTSLELSNNTTTTIQFGRGVLQGDPLSPILFNHIMDRALKKLDDDLGYPCGGFSITSTAFADDVTVIGDSVVGTQSNINSLIGELAKYGLQANPSKCLSLSIMTDGRSRAKILDTNEKFTIDGQPIKPISPSTKWTYLGINWTGEKIDKQLPDIRPKLKRVIDAVLKPQQKLEIISKVIVPGIFHQAILGNASQEELSSIDVHVRDTVRKIMHFPHDIPTVYIHAPVKCGGMGVPELLIRIPILRYKRMKRFADSDAPTATQFDRSIAYRHNKEKFETFLRQNDLVVKDHGVGVVVQYYLAQIEHYFATKGLSEVLYSRQSRHWCNKWANELSGGDFIKYNHISSHSLPTLARRAWGRPDKDVRCRHGCGCPETINHVQQQCILTKGGRSLRHDRALELIHSAIVRKFGDKFSIEKEPNLMTPHGLRKPDLILHGGNDATVIDLNIVGREDMATARENKIAKYRDLPGFIQVIQQRYGVGTVTFYAITISNCGIIDRLSMEVLRTLNFNSADIFRIVTSVLRGSWLNWFQFKKRYQQPFFDARHRT